MELSRPRSGLQRMQFISAREGNLHPKDLLDFDQVLVDVLDQPWRIAAVFANQGILGPAKIIHHRFHTDADDKVPVLWLRGGPGCSLNLYLDEISHWIVGLPITRRFRF